MYQLSAELRTTPNDPLQQSLEQVAYRLALEAALESLALGPAESTVSATGPVSSQVELLLVSWPEPQLALDLQRRWPQMWLARLLALRAQRVVDHER